MKKYLINILFAIPLVVFVGVLIFYYSNVAIYLAGEEEKVQYTSSFSIVNQSETPFKAYRMHWYDTEDLITYHSEEPPYPRTSTGPVAFETGSIFSTDLERELSRAKTEHLECDMYVVLFPEKEGEPEIEKEVGRITFDAQTGDHYVLTISGSLDEGYTQTLTKADQQP